MQYPEVVNFAYKIGNILKEEVPLGLLNFESDCPIGSEEVCIKGKQQLIIKLIQVEKTQSHAHLTYEIIGIITIT